MAQEAYYRKVGRNIPIIKLGILLGFLFVDLRPADEIAGASPPKIRMVIPTFLGNAHRSYYGPGPAPFKLSLLWKTPLGSGKTWTQKGLATWSGCGWTGQPLIVEENGRPYIIQGTYSHRLLKIDGETGRIIWQYKFDDVIKGTGTIFTKGDQVIILQGSRKGVNRRVRSSNPCPSFRAIDYKTGRELWRLDIPPTESYSRDVDGSGLILGDFLWLGAENGLLYLINPDPSAPMRVLKTLKLYDRRDVRRHGGNLVIESSPALCKDKVIVTAGSGHVYGVDVHTFTINFDFYIGSDLDGSPVVTEDGHVLVPVEKQYITGKGGVFKLDPSKPPSQAVCWYFPTGDRKLAEWQGGVIGSVGINDSYNKRGKKPALAAFSAIDGNLYIVSQNLLSPSKVLGPDGKTLYPTPRKIFSQNIGGSISTPIFFGDEEYDWLIAAGYNGLYLFRIDYLKTNANDPELLPTKSGEYKRAKVTLLDHFKKGTSFEATPVVYRGRIYIGSRDGYLYCLGER